MGKKIFGVIVTLIIVNSAQHLRATGFAIYELGARAAALAGAFSARADDATAIYYNPAGMAFLDGFRIKPNIQFSSLKTTAFSPYSDTNFTTDLLQIQGLYYFTWSLGDKLTFGFGRFTPYSTDTEWNGEWPGNSACISSQLTTYYYRPALAVKLMPGLALGVGIDFVFSKVEWSHNLRFPNETILPGSDPLYMDSRHYTKGNGIGFVTGLLWKIGKKLQVGGKYQHKVNIDAKGNNTFHDPFRGGGYGSMPGPDNKLVSIYTLMQSYFQVQDVTFRVALPTEMVLGLMFAPMDKLMLLLDFQWSQWSEAMKWEFQSDKTGGDLSPEFKEQYADFFGITPDYGIQSADLSWKDTWSIKFGMEYHLSQALSLRVGYAYHPSAFENKAIHPVIPDLDSNIISLGMGIEGSLFSEWDDKKLNDFYLDLFVQYMFTNDQTSSLSGFDFSYNADRLVFGAGVGFGF